MSEPTTVPRVCRGIDEFRTALADRLGAVPQQPSLGLVPTMGALHEGHGHLVRLARQENAVVAVSVFVNPLQFGPDEDLERYPRTLEADVELLSRFGADLVFAPSEAEMYPDGEPLVRVTSGRLGSVLDGASRPGHFDGALTVVNKLLNITAPPVPAAFRAYFGEKDAQQLLLVRRMVADFDLPVTVRAVPIVRDDDGLALSSRNRYLDAAQRRAALVLPRTLRALAAGELDLGAARRRIDAEDLVRLDYLVVVDPRTLAPVEPAPGALALVAAHVGGTRLIDNLVL
ncbi:pantoate--beta-alanine ligase [Kocuria rosea subsp. polaris]|uniref:Pantothenate synthetase n=1 Tax=Kocuria rosea subsp. polaris TaxID=136273 RepID=A0A0W8I341_KOCRO|nr:pantoate--beta-alanine ligase [Kocuria polaris]KUG52152.1 pantoate--beta-alanine ligase [Kocuria polaris]